MMDLVRFREKKKPFRWIPVQLHGSAYRKQRIRLTEAGNLTLTTTSELHRLAVVLFLFALAHSTLLGILPLPT